MADDLTLELIPGNYAFGERAVIRVVGTGNETYLWIGLDNKNGSCLGVLHGKHLQQLLDVTYRRKTRRGPPPPKDLGKTARAVKAFRPDGRKRSR